MNLEQLYASDYMLLKAVVGSNLYGLNTKNSDVDHKGIFVLPNKELGKMHRIEQISDEKQDNTFYEIGRFLQLAMKANPNILELFYLPPKMILQKTSAYEILVKNRDLFLTKAIRNSLGGYAIAQIHKARGKNKKIVNPVDKIRKTPMDFCYILGITGAKPLKEWLTIQRGDGFKQEKYGLSKVNHIHNTYYLYYDEDIYDFRGIMSEDGNELRLSSIPKEAIIGFEVLYYNSEGYSEHCKDYKDYWDWMENRNEARYASVENHGKGYDGKNLMHCFRLLDMGIDAANTGKLIVERYNRNWLLKVKHGEFEYDDLITQAEEKLEEFDKAIEDCDLPTKVDINKVNDILLEIREDHENSKKEI